MLVFEAVRIMLAIASATLADWTARTPRQWFERERPFQQPPPPPLPNLLRDAHGIAPSARPVRRVVRSAP